MKPPETIFDPAVKAGLYAKLERQAREFAAREAAAPENLTDAQAALAALPESAGSQRVDAARRVQECEAAAAHRPDDFVQTIGWAMHWHREVRVPVVRTDGAIDVERLVADVRAALDVLFAEAEAARES